MKRGASDGGTAMPQILVLEPYPPLRQALACVLQRAGWDVVTAQTDHEMLAALAQDTHDVLLVDLESWADHGWRVLQGLQDAPTHPAVVLLLHPESPWRPEVWARGVRVIVPTPMRREALLTGVQAALTRAGGAR
jgi:DNA-binding response OmpR family regulator